MDLTHEIPAGDIRAGAFALMAGCSFFPKGTVHVAVVDPGVGSQRRAIAVQTENSFFLGPDNGVLSFALRHEQIKLVCQLTNSAYWLRAISRAFHGRDVFAPVAAHLACGLHIRRLGPPLKVFVQLPWPAFTEQRGEVVGEVIYVDRFGNAITNIPATVIESRGTRTVWASGRRLCGMADFYEAVTLGKAVAVPGSSGYLEIVVHGGSAAARFRLRPGTRVMVCRARRSHAR